MSVYLGPTLREKWDRGHFKRKWRKTVCV